MSKISRREFLRLSAVGAGGLVLAGCDTATQGAVTEVTKAADTPTTRPLDVTKTPVPTIEASATTVPTDVPEYSKLIGPSGGEYSPEQQALLESPEYKEQEKKMGMWFDLWAASIVKGKNEAGEEVEGTLFDKAVMAASKVGRVARYKPLFNSLDPSAVTLAQAALEIQFMDGQWYTVVPPRNDFKRVVPIPQKEGELLAPLDSPLRLTAGDKEWELALGIDGQGRIVRRETRPEHRGEVVFMVEPDSVQWMPMVGVTIDPGPFSKEEPGRWEMTPRLDVVEESRLFLNQLNLNLYYARKAMEATGQKLRISNGIRTTGLGSDGNSVDFKAADGEDALVAPTMAVHTVLPSGRVVPGYVCVDLEGNIAVGYSLYGEFEPDKIWEGKLVAMTSRNESVFDHLENDLGIVDEELDFLRKVNRLWGVSNIAVTGFNIGARG